MNDLFCTDEEIVDLYSRHVNTVYKVCFMYLKNRYDTEDAVQNVFVKLIAAKKIFEDAAHEKAWLIVTASNECKNFLKSSWKKRVLSAIYMQEKEYSDHTNESEVLEKVFNLPAKYKDVVYLYYYEGYPTKEIASMLKKTDSAIRSRLHKARKLLKMEMEDDRYEAR